jgi:hypothetical protein
MTPSMLLLACRFLFPRIQLTLHDVVLFIEEKLYIEKGEGNELGQPSYLLSRVQYHLITNTENTSSLESGKQKYRVVGK